MANTTVEPGRLTQREWRVLRAMYRGDEVVYGTRWIYSLIEKKLIRFIEQGGDYLLDFTRRGKKVCEARWGKKGR